MSTFYSGKWENIFLLYINDSTTNEISNIFLTMAHIVIHNVGNNGDIHRSLKCCIQNFKISFKNIKINKFKGRKKGPQYLIISFYLKYISTFNKSVIKNSIVKR